MFLIFTICLLMVGIASGMPDSGIRDGKVVNLTLGLAQEVVFEPNTVTPLDIYPDGGSKKTNKTKYAFYCIEVHTHSFPVILEDSKVVRNSSIERFDGGLLIPFTINTTMRVYVTNNYNSKVYGVSLARGIEARDPIPGMGSASNSTKEIRPDVQVTWDDFTTKISFREAGSVQSDDFQTSFTSGKIYNYEVYQFWFPEGDFEVDDYVNSLTSMLFIQDIRINGHLVETYYLNRNLDSGYIEVTFPSFPNTLQLFAVIVTSEDSGKVVHEASYTSGITSGCLMRAYLGKDQTMLPTWRCTTVYYTESKVLVGFCLVFGLFLILVGHRFFAASQFIFGMFMAAIISWPLAIGLFHLKHLGAILFAAGFGICAGILGLLIWVCGKFIIFSTSIANVVNGLLVGTTVVHIANLCQSRSMMSDAIFFGTLTAVTCLYFICTIRFLKWAHLVSCCMVGSFVLACCLDHYLGSTIRYILLNLLRRCSVGDYRDVCPQLPFQDNEKIVVSVWVVLAVVSFSFQFWRYRHQVPFQQSPLDNVIAVEVTPVNMMDDERVPLLGSQLSAEGSESQNPRASAPPPADEDESDPTAPQRQEVVGYIEGYGAITAPPPPFLRVYRDPRFYQDRDIRSFPSRQPRRPWTFSLFQRSSQRSSQQSSERQVRDIFRPPDINNSPS